MNIIWFGLIIIVTVSYLSKNYYKRRSLNTNFKITNGYIYGVNRGTLVKGGGNTVIKFSFYIQNKKYYGGTDSGLSYIVKDTLLNSYFPIAYDSTNPSNSILLAFESDWERLNLKFPDSINWIRKYYPN